MLFKHYVSLLKLYAATFESDARSANIYIVSIHNCIELYFSCHLKDLDGTAGVGVWVHSITKTRLGLCWAFQKKISRQSLVS
jgi:hypothetical protein